MGSMYKPTKVDPNIILKWNKKKSLRFLYKSWKAGLIDEEEYDYLRALVLSQVPSS